jgi:hypothetical protein
MYADNGAMQLVRARNGLIYADNLFGDAPTTPRC